jgi:hypothetical protein
MGYIVSALPYEKVIPDLISFNVVILEEDLTLIQYN